jgi:hypothetical protein
VSTDWLAAATAEYQDVIAGPARSPAEMLGSARAFARRIAEVAASGDEGLRVLEAGLRDAGSLRDDAALRANTAARILSAIAVPRAAELLLAAMRRENRLDASHLQRLARTQQVEHWPALDAVPDRVKGDLALAIAGNDTALLDQIVDGHHGVRPQLVVPVLAARSDLERLRTVAARPPDTVPRGRDRMLFADDDAAPLAAAYLALAGDSDAVESLVAMTRDSRHPYAGPAVMHLGRLGHPRAVEPAARLFKARKLDTVALALDAASALGTPQLGTALLDLVAARRGAAAYSTGTVSEDAARVVDELVGADAARNPLALRTKLQELDPALRYRNGQPLTLARLAHELASPHAGPRAQAAWGLRAATGEDHGYALDDDLAANVAAIDAWQTRARDPEPMGSGGWAFLGTRIAPP